MLKWLLPLIMLPLCLHAQPQPFSAEISLSATQISIEENLAVELLLSYPDTHIVDLEKLRINLLKYGGLSEPPFALVDEQAKTLPDGAHKIMFTLEPQLAGQQFISLYDIVFLPKNPEQHQPVEFISDIFAITVTLPPPEQNYQGMSTPLLSLTQQFPITIDPSNRKNLLENPALNRQVAQSNVSTLRQRAFPWKGLTGALLFAVVIFIARMQPPRRKDLDKERRKQALSARNKAQQALEGLQPKNTPPEMYYNALTDTVRHYIEERFQIQATKQTTEEFLEAVAIHALFDTQTQSRLADFLAAADLVKFAEATPSEEALEQAYTLAEQFIAKSRVTNPLDSKNNSYF